VELPAAVAAPALRPADGSGSLRCLARCDRWFEAGVYRLLIDPTESVAGGMARVNVSAPGIYHVEGAPRERRAYGLVLASAGMIVTGIGTGMIFGANAFDTHLSAQEERWFWGGMLTFAAGISAIPIGFSLYGRSPKISPTSVAHGVPRVTGDASLPHSYREPVITDQQVPPPGSTTVNEPRWGLVMAGAVTFASAYGIMAGIAVGVAVNETHDPWRYSSLMIPIIGPALVDRQEHTGPAFTFYGTIPQVAGGILMLIGATTSRSVVVKSDTSVSIAPLIYKDAGGLSLMGTF